MSDLLALYLVAGVVMAQFLVARSFTAFAQVGFWVFPLCFVGAVLWPITLGAVLMLEALAALGRRAS
jgi:hypothetical protein